MVELIETTDCPYYLISRVSLTITSVLKKSLINSKVKSVKPAYLGVLFSLWKQDDLRVVELGKRAGLEPSTMTGLLDRMEKDKLLFRKPDTNDRRVLKICLTDYGKKLQDKVVKIVNKTLLNAINNVSEKDIETTKNVLRQILKNAV